MRNCLAFSGRPWVDRDEELPIESWRGDQGLLANAMSGEALPVGDLQVRRYCTMEGESTTLASLRGGAPLLARATTDQGGVYFWATTPVPSDSSLAADGVVLYVAGPASGRLGSPRSSATRGI